MPIPIVNEVHLHSMYNPVKEATTFVKKYKSAINKKNHYLIFGLGFAYHINQLLSTIEKKVKIIVIEPNYRIARECLKRKLLKNADKITIFKGMEIEELYREKKLIDFMVQAPSILAHIASYNLYLDYFVAFMNYRASTNINKISADIKDRKVKECLMGYGQQIEIPHLSQKIKQSRNLTSEEMILGSFLSTCGETNLVDTSKML